MSSLASKGPARPMPALPLLGAAERTLLEASFRTLLPVAHGTEPHLAGVLHDTLAHPGSLARAQLAFGVATELGTPAESACQLAIAIEYFHTASLLFDDLPAMDDARERRGFPCPHVVHGEAAAMLGALALITRSYQLLWQVLATVPAARAAAAGALVAECLGAAGVLQGQSLDLHFADRNHDERSEALAVERVAMGKTVPLVRLSLVFPALVGGASTAELERLERLSIAWGLAYQGLDDGKDPLLDPAETGKSTARDALLGRPNLSAALGWPALLDRLEGWLEEGRSLVAALRATRPGWRRLEGLQHHLEVELRTLSSRLANERQTAQAA